MIKPVELVVIGASSGGLDVLIQLLQALPEQYQIPTVAILHQRPNRASGVPKMLSRYTHLRVQEPEDKQAIELGSFYVAPPNYHLLVDPEKVFSFSVDAPLNYCRPSIDMAFQSAAEVYQDRLVGCILTGANSDGANGVRAIKANNGCVYVQSPDEATVNTMPLAAIDATLVDGVLSIQDLAKHLAAFAQVSAIP